MLHNDFQIFSPSRIELQLHLVIASLEIQPLLAVFTVSVLHSPAFPSHTTICIKILSQRLVLGELKLGRGLAINKVEIM